MCRSDVHAVVVPGGYVNKPWAMMEHVVKLRHSFRYLAACVKGVLTRLC